MGSRTSAFVGGSGQRIRGRLRRFASRPQCHRTLQAASPSDTTRNAELDAELRRRFGVFGPGVIGTDRDLVMSNDQVRVTFNTRGGLPVAATLQDGYTRYGSDEPVSLWVREQSDMNVAWDVPGVGRVGFQDLHFKPISEGPTQLVLESDLGDNNAIRIVHKLEGYQVKTDINFIGVDRLTEANGSSRGMRLGNGTKKACSGSVSTAPSTTWSLAKSAIT